MRRLLFLLLLLPALSSVHARAADLVTRDGKVYHDYKVLSHDAGFLTIMYSDGGGKIPLSDLPDDLQKQYGYNKQQADAFVQASIAQDRQDRQAIAQEQEQHQQQMAARAQAEANGTPLPPTAPAPAAASAPATSAPANPPVAVAGPSSAPPPSQADVDAVKQNISDVEDDMVSWQVQGGHQNADDAASQRLSQDTAKLKDLKNKLYQMEEAQEPRILTWDDVSALHEQIVQVGDDEGATISDGVTQGAAGYRTQYKVQDDIDQITELRRILGIIPRAPLTLTPDQVDAIKQKIAAINADLEVLIAPPASMSSETPNSGPKLRESGGSRGAAPHEVSEDKEQLLLLNEQLSFAHQQ